MTLLRQQEARAIFYRRRLLSLFPAHVSLALTLNLLAVTPALAHRRGLYNRDHGRDYPGTCDLGPPDVPRLQIADRFLPTPGSSPYWLFFTTAIYFLHQYIS